MLKYINQFIYNFFTFNHFRTEAYGEECPICLEIFGELDDVKLFCTLKCGHSYHKKCIDNWLLKDDSCPNCRKSVKAN